MLWLNGVVVRLVKEMATFHRSKFVSSSSLSSSSKESGDYIPGFSKGIQVRRSMDGDLVVDIEVTPAEADTVV